MADASLGDAVGRIILDPSGVLTGMQRAQEAARTGFAGIGQHITSVGTQLSGFGTNLTMLMAPFTAAMGLGLKTFASFEDALAEIQARTGATDDAMARVQATALDMGAKTKYSATQAAEAMLQLLSSGYSLEETFAALPAVLNAAAAGGMDLGYTADVVTDALAMWNLKAADATRVTDALVRGAGASSAEINDLAQGLGNVGPMAATFGLSIEDTIAVLAAFSERGIKGAEAGTQLRSMLTRMTSNVPAVTSKWKDLGISLYDAQGAMRPLWQIMAELRNRMTGMTPEEQIDTLKTLGGTYGQMGLTILTSSPAMENMSALMSNQSDAATVAAARMNTLSGTTESLRGSIETLMITALQPFVENSLKPAIRRTTELVNKMTEWAAKNPALVTQVIKLLAVLIPLGPALFTAGKALSAIGYLIGALGSPIGLLIMVAGLLYKAWSSTFLGIQDAVQAFVERFAVYFAWIGHNVELAIQAISSGDWTAALYFIEQAWLGVKQFLGQLLTPLVEWGTQAAATLWQWVQAAIPPLLAKLGELAGQVWAWVTAQVPVVVAKLRDWGQAFVDWVSPMIPPLLGKLLALISKLITWVGEQLPGIAAQLKEWGQKFVDWVIPAAEALLLQLPSLIADVLKWILDVAPDLIAQMLVWAAAFVSFVGPLIVDLLVKLAGLAGDVIEWVLSEFIPKILEQVPGLVAAFLKFVGEAQEKIPPALLDFLGTLVRFIVNDLIPGMMTAVESIGSSIVNGIKQGIENAWAGLESYLKDKIEGGIVGDVAGYLGVGSPSKVFEGFGESIVQGLAQGLGRLNALDQALGNMSTMLLTPALAAPAPALAGAGMGGGNVTNYYQISVPVTADTMRQYPQAAEYAREVGDSLEARMKSARRWEGGGIVG